MKKAAKNQHGAIISLESVLIGGGGRMGEGFSRQPRRF